MKKINKKKISAVVVLSLTAIGVGKLAIKKIAAIKKSKETQEVQLSDGKTDLTDDKTGCAGETGEDRGSFDITEFTDSQKAYDIMGVSEWEQTKSAHDERRMAVMNEVHDILCEMVNEKNCYIVVSDVAKDTESESTQNGAVIAKELYFMNEENKYLGEIKLESELDKFNDLSEGHTVIAYTGTYIDKTKNLDGKWIKNAKSAIENTGYIINIDTIGSTERPVISTIEKRENIEGKLVTKVIYNAAEEKEKTLVKTAKPRVEKQNSDENQDKKAVSQSLNAADTKTDKKPDAESEEKETVKNTGYKDILDCSFF